MNEYYKERYNISNYFLNIDNDEYNYNIIIIIPLIYIILIISTIIPIIYIIINKRINITIIIYFIFLIVYYIISIKLIISLNNISNNNLLKRYNNYYSLLNVIFKENLDNINFKSSSDKYLSINDSLIKNINNIENVYGNKAYELKNTTNDILKYFTYNNKNNENIENIYTSRLYITFKDFRYLHKNLPYISDDVVNDDLEEEHNYYIDLKILEEYHKGTRERELILDYINKKYNKRFNDLYISSILTSKFKENFNNLINDFKRNIYNYIYISIFFIIVSLQNLLIDFNIIIVHIYIAIILILIIFMYFYTN